MVVVATVSPKSVDWLSLVEELPPIVELLPDTVDPSELLETVLPKEELSE